MEPRTRVEPHRVTERNALSGRRPDMGGFTLVDMVVSMLILSLVLGGLYTWLISTTRAATTISTRSNLSLDASRTSERIAGRIIAAGLETLTPENPEAPLGTSSLTFQRGAGFAAGAKVWESPARIELRYAPGEIDDGIDNNGNGLIDEGVIYFAVNAGLPNEKEVAWVSNVREYWGDEIPNGEDDNGNGLVDERGLSFELDGDRLVVRISLEGTLEGGAVIRSDIETSVRLRN